MLAQAVAERAQFIPEQFLIYADLDMVLKSEPRFGNLDGHFIIGEYTESDKMTPELAYRFKRMSGFECPVHNTTTSRKYQRAKNIEVFSTRT